MARVPPGAKSSRPGAPTPSRRRAGPCACRVGGASGGCRRCAAARGQAQQPRAARIEEEVDRQIVARCSPVRGPCRRCRGRRPPAGGPRAHGRRRRHGTTGSGADDRDQDAQPGRPRARSRRGSLDPQLGVAPSQGAQHLVAMTMSPRYRSRVTSTDRRRRPSSSQLMRHRPARRAPGPPPRRRARSSTTSQARFAGPAPTYPLLLRPRRSRCGPGAAPRPAARPSPRRSALSPIIQLRRGSQP